MCVMIDANNYELGRMGCQVTSQDFTSTHVAAFTYSYP